jgi:hypothetical protein
MSLQNPPKEKIKSEDFVKCLKERGGLHMFFFQDLYDNHKDIINNADIIDLNLFFLLQTNVHPEVYERFWGEFDEDLKSMLSNIKFLGREFKRKKKYDNTLTNGVYQVIGLTNGRYEIDCVLSVDGNLNVGDELLKLHNKNIFKNHCVRMVWEGYGEEYGEFTLKIRIE